MLQNKDITIKPGDKGGAIVILNTQDYISEALRQLSKTQHYVRQHTEPTKRHQDQVTRTVTQANDMDIIDDDTKTLITTTFSRTPNFYLLPKIQKASKSG